MSLHVMDRGQGAPAFLLLHGFGSSSTLWDEVVEVLEPEHRCVAPDLRGFGRSSGAVARLDDHLDDLEALIRERGLADYVLAGHSMGGKIAAALAARRPAGLRSVVLTAASPLGPEPMTQSARTELLAAQGDAAAAEALVEKIAFAELRTEARVAFIADNVSTTPSAWRWWLEAGSREDLSRRASSIQAPVLVLAGSRDPVLGLAVQNEAVRLLRAERLVLSGAAGHLIPLEDPSTCLRVLRAAAGRGVPQGPELVRRAA